MQIQPGAIKVKLWLIILIYKQKKLNHVMLNGDGNDNGIKINRSNQQKNKLHVQHTLFLLISKKQIFSCNTFFVFLYHCFSQLQRCFVGLKRQTSQLHVIIMEELSYVLTQYFVSCVHFRFYFSLPLIFTLLATSISHCLTATLNFHVFFLQSSLLLFSITRLALSVLSTGV